MTLGGALIGKYRLQQELGTGGMGAVWLGVHVELGWPAAVKVLHAELAESPDIVQRFFNEARAAGAVNDPGIVEIFDFGFTPEGLAYIVMELLDGESLASRLRVMGRLSLETSIAIMRQVARSLGAAHARGIIHRDLKPDNVFLVRDPNGGSERVKVLDFGIAKLEWGGNVKTRTHAVMGTPMYMSPEQCRGEKDLDHRSDVYAMGCVLFALLAGFPPFFAEGPGQVFLMHLQTPPPTVASRQVAVPPALEALIARCLAKQPAQRYADGIELADELDRFAGVTPPTRSAQLAAQQQQQAQSSMVSLVRAAEGVALPVPDDAPASYPPAPESNARAWIVVAILVVVVATAITIALLLT